MKTGKHRLFASARACGCGAIATPAAARKKYDLVARDTEIKVGI